MRRLKHENPRKIRSDTQIGLALTFNEIMGDWFWDTSGAGRCSPFWHVSANGEKKSCALRTLNCIHRWRWIVKKGRTSQHRRCIKISLPSTGKTLRYLSLSHTMPSSGQGGLSSCLPDRLWSSHWPAALTATLPMPAGCQHLGGSENSPIQKNPGVHNFSARNSGAGNGCANIMDAAFLPTIGSFLLTVEVFYLQLTILAFLLTIGAFSLTVLASLLTVGAFCLQWESASDKSLKGL